MLYPLNRFKSGRHPEGQYSGEIISVEDIGVVPFGGRHQHMLRILIESRLENAQAGVPYHISFRLGLTPSTHSWLHKLRRAARGQELTRAERRCLNDEELIGIRVDYEVVHTYNAAGTLVHRIADVWPLKEEQVDLAEAV